MKVFHNFHSIWGYKNDQKALVVEFESNVFDSKIHTLRTVDILVFICYSLYHIYIYICICVLNLLKTYQVFNNKRNENKVLIFLKLNFNLINF